MRTGIIRIKGKKYRIIAGKASSFLFTEAEYQNAMMRYNKHRAIIGQCELYKMS